MHTHNLLLYIWKNFLKIIILTKLELKNHELLSKNLSLEEARILQEKYSLKIKNQHKASHLLKEKDIKYIAGVDISYFNRNSEEWGISCAVLWDFQENVRKNQTFHIDIITFPYKPGFLGFRECYLFAQAISKLGEGPDVILCDGQGLIHPKRFGEAVQLGFALDIPTIGVAKNPFIGKSNWKSLVRKRGERTPIWANDLKKREKYIQELLGYAMCLNNDMKPVFVSVGYKISINLAIEIVLKTSITHRQPEPLYLAHKLSKEKVKTIN